MATLAAGQHQNVVIELDCNSVKVDSYPGAIIQILGNLFHNSIHYGFADEADGKVWVKVTDEGDQVRLIFRDNGQGMDEQTKRLKKIQQFRAACKRNGAGLPRTLTSSTRAFGELLRARLNAWTHSSG